MTRLDRLRSKMAEHAVDLVVLAPGAHMAWLMDVRPHGDERPLLALVTQTDAGFLMPALEADAVRQGTDLPFFCWPDAKGPDAALEQLIAEFGLGQTRHYVFDEAMRADHAALIQDRLPDAARPFTQSTLSALRRRKDATKSAVLQRNAQTADLAMQAAWAAMRRGQTERDVAQVVHRVVDAAALAAAKSDRSACDVGTADRRIITQTGYGEFFTHRTGHGLGTELHEPPYITATSQTVLNEGMVFSVEPGIYLTGRFGVRLEEIVIIPSQGAQSLSNLPRDFRVI